MTHTKIQYKEHSALGQQHLKNIFLVCTVSRLVEKHWITGDQLIILDFKISTMKLLYYGLHIYINV